MYLLALHTSGGPCEVASGAVPMSDPAEIISESGCHGYASVRSLTVNTPAGSRDELGLVLRRRRAELGLTQEDLADRTGLSVRAISNIERGLTPRPRRSSVHLLGRALELDQDGLPGLATALDQDDHEAPARVVPRQLPAATPYFTGRAAELSLLSDLLDQAAGNGAAGAVSVISGTAGVGKTALALHWAHQVADRFPDGQLYVDLRGFGPATPAAPQDVLCGFLEALSVPATRIPAQTDARAGMYRSLLAGRRLLVLLDNASDTDQVRLLLPGGPGCLALVTSRSRLNGLVVTGGARQVALDVLTAAEARNLLAARLGADRLKDDGVAADDLVELTAGLPLALSIAAARATEHHAHPLATLAAELRDTHGRLEVLDGGETSADVRAAMSWSYRRLSDPAAQVFRMLGLHPGPDVTADATASLAGCSQRTARRALTELTIAGLLAEHAPGRFGCHDLLRVYAAELGRDCDPLGATRAAQRRMLDHYLHTAHAGMLLVDASAQRLPLERPVPGVRPKVVSSDSAAAKWFTAEHYVLLSVAAEAVRTGHDAHAWLLPATMTAALSHSGHWHEWVAAQRAALAAARRLGDPYAQAWTHRGLGYALARLRQDEEATVHLEHALRIFAVIGDKTGQAHTHCAFAVLLDPQDRRRESLDHARLALQLFQATGGILGQAVALNEMAWDHIQLGDHQQAVTCGERALQLSGAAGNHTIAGHTWDSLGMAHLRLGQTARAIDCYREAIGKFRRVGHRPGEGVSLAHLGDALHSGGDVAGARRSWRQALTILTELRQPEADGVRARLKLSGQVLSARPAVLPVKLP